MDAKIPATFWSDPDMEPLPMEVRLTLLWSKTNPARNDCGAYRFTASRFTLETGLDASWHEKTAAALPAHFMREGHWVLYLPFIKECLQLGHVIGKGGFVNKGAIALAKPFRALPNPLQRALLDTYPELASVWKPFTSPSVPDAEALTTGQRSEKTAAPEALGNPLPRGRAEQSSTEQSRAEGECEGGQPPADGDPGEPAGALIPSEEDVMAYARTFQDLARGLNGIQEAYALKWLAWRSTPKAGPFPRRWQDDLRRRYVGDLLEGKTAATGPLGDRSKRLADLKTRLGRGGLSPDERAALREAIKKLEGVEK